MRPGSACSVAEILQHVGGGGILAGLARLASRQSHDVEEDGPDLAGRAHVELLAGGFVDLVFELGHLLGEGVRHARQDVLVDLDARHFHVGQDGDKGAFQRLVDRCDARGVKLGAERLPEPERDVGVLGGIGHGVVDLDRVEGPLRLA